MTTPPEQTPPPPTTQEIPAQSGVVNTIRDWAATTIGIMLLLGGFAVFVLHSASANASQYDELRKTQISELREQFDTHVKDAASTNRSRDADIAQLRRDVNESESRQMASNDRLEMKMHDLYQAVMYGKHSPELERPPRLPDGGVK